VILASYALGAATFLVYAVCVPLSFWVRPPQAPVARHVVVALGAHLAGTAAAFVYFPELQYWLGAAAHWLLFYVYLWLFGAFYASLSLRTARWLARQPDRSASLEAMRREVIDVSFDDRIASLLAKGLIEGDASGYTVTPAGRRLASRLEASRRWFKIDLPGVWWVGR